MYDFAVVALLGLAVFKLVDLLESVVPPLRRMHALVALGLGVVAALVLDYSVFRGFGITLRNDTLGIWATGLMIGGMGTVWRAALAWIGWSEDETFEHRPARRPHIAA